MIYATDIKAHGIDTFLQFIEHNTTDYKAIALDDIKCITFVRPYFLIELKW